jgi:hypothetical protein
MIAPLAAADSETSLGKLPPGGQDPPMETPLQCVLRLARGLEEAERDLLAGVEAHDRERRRRAA